MESSSPSALLSTPPRAPRPLCACALAHSLTLSQGSKIFKRKVDPFPPFLMMASFSFLLLFLPPSLLYFNLLSVQVTGIQCVHTACSPHHHPPPEPSLPKWKLHPLNRLPGPFLPAPSSHRSALSRCVFRVRLISLSTMSLGAPAVAGGRVVFLLYA